MRVQFSFAEARHFNGDLYDIKTRVYFGRILKAVFTVLFAVLCTF